MPRLRLSAVVLFLSVGIASGEPNVAGSETGPVAPLDTLIAATRPQEPAPLCDDATFLRRVNLDLVGVVPSSVEVEAFLKDTGADKRQRKVDELLDSPLFNHHWASLISNLVVAQTQKKALQSVTQKSFEAWLADRLKAKDGYDKIVREVISASGPLSDNPATAFVIGKDARPDELAALAGKAFLGVQIQCAQCHDHPFEKWTRKDFYGIMAFFARTRTTQAPEPALALYRTGLPPQAIRALLGMGGNKGKEKPGRPEQQERRKRRLQKAMRKLEQMQADGAGGDSMGGEAGADTPPSPRGVSSQDVQQLVDKIRAQLQEKGPAGKPKFRRVSVVVDIPRGEAIIPDANQPQPEKNKQVVGERIEPRFLDGTTPTADGGGKERRQILATWMTSADNPYFARATVNRVAAQLLGRGLVEPVDNITSPAEGSLAPVLTHMATTFAATHFDLRGLIRGIANSRTYQRSAGPAPKTKDRLVHYTPRQLGAEQLFASFLRATGVEDVMRIRKGDRLERLKETHLRLFVFTFDTDEAAEVEVFHESVTQALLLLNAQLINAPVEAVPGTALHTVLSATTDPRTRIDQLYLSALSRHATPAELNHLAKYVQEQHSQDPQIVPEDAPIRPEDFLGRPNRKRGGRGQARAQRMLAEMRERGVVSSPAAPAPAASAVPSTSVQLALSAGERRAYEDIFWSLVSSAEFIYNH